MTAAGVAGSRPAVMSRAAMTGSVAMPMRITSVSTAVARRSPVDAARRLVRILVAGDDGER